MASPKTKTQPKAVIVGDEADSKPIPRIKKITIRNFGCIGSSAVDVEIDKIVVLIGANNSGKSTILRAIEVIADNEKLTIDDFHNRAIDPEHLPEVELESIATVDNKPGDEWCRARENDEFIIREKWLWNGPGVEPERVGFLWEEGKWADSTSKEKCPWGMTNKAKTKRPKPHRVGTFDTPEVQSNAVTALFADYLLDKINQHDALPDSKILGISKIKDHIRLLKNHVKDGQTEEIESVNRKANELIGKIFPNQRLSIQSKEAGGNFELSIISDEYSVEFGSQNGQLFPIEKQGSGTRRTILWTILKLLADMGLKATNSQRGKKIDALGKYQSHILLLDEPELSLHPSAISNARDVLYSLPSNENWQVVVATHSPNFIDLTKDNTTIIRVEMDGLNIKTTTLYRPDTAQLSSDDKTNLKLRNSFDSHISEAFFGGRILVVEGDTEYSAFNYIKEAESENGNDNYSDLHVIRARGKVTIASMMKVLNHFKARYFVLHDFDTMKTMSKRRVSKQDSGILRYVEKEITNPAWTNNEKIRDQMSEHSFVCASVPNFELANFEEVVEKEKPEECIRRMRGNSEVFQRIKSVLDGIISGNSNNLPAGVIRWETMEDAVNAVTSYTAHSEIEKARGS